MMKVLFQNNTEHTVYIGWIDYYHYLTIETPNVLLLQPYAEVFINTNDRYFLSVRIEDTYLFDTKIATATKIVIIDDTTPFLMFYYDFDVDLYQTYQPHLPSSYPIHTWRAHYLQGDMKNKLILNY